MSGRGSKLSRAVEYFETADLREVKAAKIIVDEVYAGRVKAETAQMSLPKPKRTRKKKVATAPAPTEQVPYAASA